MHIYIYDGFSFVIVSAFPSEIQGTHKMQKQRQSEQEFEDKPMLKSRVRLQTKPVPLYLDKKVEIHTNSASFTCQIEGQMA